MKTKGFRLCAFVAIHIPDAETSRQWEMKLVAQALVVWRIRLNWESSDPQGVGLHDLEAFALVAAEKFRCGR